MGAAASVPKDRTQTLKVIGAGYSHTGTLSMALALEKLLDGPVMHGGSQFLGREDSYLRLWSRIFTAHAQNDRSLLLRLLREATAGFVAITDAPGNCFIEELLELYPGAQVICVSRDRQKWFKSWESVTNTAKQGVLKWVLMPVPGKRWFPGLVGQFLGMQEARFGPNSLDWMDKHNEYVKAITPSKRFHMMELKEGWAPLCKILGTAIPDEPFPRANDAEAVKGVESQIMREAGMIWAGIFAVASVLVYGALWTL